MSAWDSIRSIRVVRQFTTDAVDPNHIERILNAGRRAGSSKNLQRWSFIVIRDRRHLDELSKIGPFAGHLAGAAFAIALITPDPTADGQPLSVMFDLGRAAQNMVLAAWDLGIGSVPATVYEHGLAAELLRLPAGQHCEYLLSFGYPSDASALRRPSQKGGRLRLGEVVHEEFWNSQPDVS